MALELGYLKGGYVNLVLGFYCKITTACLGTFATSLEHTKPQFILELLYWYFDGVVE